MVNWTEISEWNPGSVHHFCDVDPAYTQAEIVAFLSRWPLLLTLAELSDSQLCNTVGCDYWLKEALLKHWCELGTVERWLNGDPHITYPNQPPFSESDAQHVEAGLLFIRDCVTKYPSLGNYIDFLTSAVMFLIHDSAETSKSGPGDTNRSSLKRLQETEAEKARKTKQELGIFLNEILPWFPIERRSMLARYAQRYYSREESRIRGNPDIAAEFAKLIDFFQGMSKAIEHVYPNPNLLPSNVTHVNLPVLPQRILDNIVELFSRIQRIEQDLFQVNSGKMDANAFWEWRDLVEELIAPLRNNGYWRYALASLTDYSGMDSMASQFPPHEEFGKIEYLPPNYIVRQNAFL